MTDAERIKQLEAEASEWKWEYENVCKFTTGYEQQRDELREENRKLEAENLVMRDALVDLSKHNCGCYPICQCPMEYIDSVVDLAKDVLKKCQNTLQLQKEREADLKVISAAKKHHGCCLLCNTCPSCDLKDYLAERERVYGERK